MNKKYEIIDGLTIKYHANGKTIWSKGKIVDGTPKRSGYFKMGEQTGTWTTYDKFGNVYKQTHFKDMNT